MISFLYIFVQAIRFLSVVQCNHIYPKPAEIWGLIKEKKVFLNCSYLLEQVQRISFASCTWNINLSLNCNCIFVMRTQTSVSSGIAISRKKKKEKEGQHCCKMKSQLWLRRLKPGNTFYRSDGRTCKHAARERVPAAPNRGRYEKETAINVKR